MNPRPYYDRDPELYEDEDHPTKEELEEFNADDEYQNPIEENN